MRHPGAAISWIAIALALGGCSTGVDATYGHSRGESINGTRVLADLFRDRGHTVRASTRLNDEEGEWADTVVRFAPYPGPPDAKEAEWFEDWLEADSERRLIYVPYDYNAESDYWSAVLARLTEKGDPKLRARAEARRDATRHWSYRLPPKAEKAASEQDWFGVVHATGDPVVCRTLSGYWAQGIDVQAAALTRHEALRVNSETVLLEGDGAALAMEWHSTSGAPVLVVASGSFLLNETLINPARRPLVGRVVEWVGREPRRILFAEGSRLLKAGSNPNDDGRSSSLPRWPPIQWAKYHVVAFLLIACLARAMILGRPRLDPPSGADRPVAHPEALGALLARTKDEAAARSLLDIYRRWRHLPAQSTKTRVPSP